MRNRFLIVVILLLASGAASAQFIDQEPSGPLFGGPGDWTYPVLCTECSSWQDYRNFAWNQLSINGGPARTPSDPKSTTTFRIYTHRTNDLHPAIVEVSLVVVDIEINGNVVGRAITDPRHYAVETHPENGDAVPTHFYPESQGPLVFPYRSSSSDSGDGPAVGDGYPSASGGGGGGDSPSGGFLGAILSSDEASTAWELWLTSFNNGNYCGAGTDYICVQL